MILRFLGSLLVLIGIFVAHGWLRTQKDNANIAWLYKEFPMGDGSIMPAQLFLGLLVSITLILLAKTLTKTLDQKLRQRPGVRASSVEALVTLASYAFYVVAVLMGISIAGISLTNLTIIAGALSVGIGFGLQNIVNNFVSGIILLIEQPVRTGDFVQVGGYEGHVKRVRIRSTEILTLEHTSVIVPNSQLISDALTNWNLHDNFCRVSVFVGVAYGSDTRLVERLLLEAARKHELVICETNGPVLAPFVQFSDFGDSALMFRLVVYIRDASKRFGVASQLRFAIDDSFRANGVSIPFPQRDLHIIGQASEPTAASKQVDQAGDNRTHHA